MIAQLLAGGKEVRLRVISFVNMKGGVAKTTLAVNVAHCLHSRDGSRVLIVDLDPQFNATQCVLSGDTYKKKLSSGMSTIVDIFEDMPKAIASTTSGTGVAEPVRLEEIRPVQLQSGFDILPGNIELYRLEMTPGLGREYRLKRYLEIVADSYDFVIIDTPPTPSVWMSTALISSDCYVVPCKAEPLSIIGIDLLKMVVEHRETNYGLNIKCGGLVLTMTEPHTLAYREAIRFINQDQFWKDYRFKHELPKRTAVARLQGSQELILDSSEFDLLLSITNITRELLERIQ